MEFQMVEIMNGDDGDTGIGQQQIGGGCSHRKVSPSVSIQSVATTCSPSSPQVQLNPKFVQLHNGTAEIYQAFKDEVDLLFSGQVPAMAQAECISHILQLGNQLMMPMEAEKQYLMSEVLCSWAVQQQKLSVSSQWTQQMNYALLNTIDCQFEYFGELLEQTLTGLGYLVTEFPGAGFEQQQQQIRQLAHLFLFYSIIVSRQPPAVVVKCGEAENHRRSRFWFNTEIRILGGRAFGLNVPGSIRSDHTQIQCHLITDETAKRLRRNAYHEVTEHEEFAVEPSLAMLRCTAGTGGGGGNAPPGLGGMEMHGMMDSGNGAGGDGMMMAVSARTMSPMMAGGGGVGGMEPGTTMLAAKFDNMRVAKKEQLRRESVAQKRYHLCYSVRLQTGKHQIDLVGKKVSLPFAILVGPKSDVEAKLFMERSFADFVRRPDGELPALVNGQEMIYALELKFQSILEIPQKPTDQIGLHQPQPFSPVSKQHLLNRLKPNAIGQVLVESFLKMPVAEEFCVNKKSIGGNKESGGGSGAQTPLAGSLPGNLVEGEWKLVPFFEWFFKLAEMVNKHFLQLWNDGLILGFCGKEEAEQLLLQCHRPTLLIRFSDIEFAKVKISVRDQRGVIRHHWYDQAELQGRNLSQELLHNDKYRDIELIWPETSLEWAIGARERSMSTCGAVQKKPRQLQPSAVYFDNQVAGIGSSSSSQNLTTRIRY